MFRQENSALPPSTPSGQQSNGKKHHRKLYALLAALAVITITAAALIIPQSSGSTMQLSLDYKVGERMVYQNTNVITNQMVNTSLSLPGVTRTQSYNSTIALDIVGMTSEYYIADETMAATPEQLESNHSPFTLNISKAGYYNFLAPGGPLIFWNSSNNPTISAYLAQSSVKVGDVWRLPLNTSNASLGLTGEVTINFAGLQDITVEAGTYRTMRIEITSNTLTAHSDNSSSYPEGMTIQFNGTSYLELSTCRLIKTDLSQVSTLNSLGVNRTATIYKEKTLIEHTKP